MTKPKTLEQLRTEKERAETQLAQEPVSYTHLRQTLSFPVVAGGPGRACRSGMLRHGWVFHLPPSRGTRLPRNQLGRRERSALLNPNKKPPAHGAGGFSMFKAACSP